MERGKHSSKIYNKTISVPCGGLKDENLYSNLDYSYKDSLLSDPRIKNLLIPSNVIHKRIKNLAKMIGDDYEEESKLNVVVVLFGAYVFAADICREIFQQTGLEITTHFIRLSKYGKSIKGENFDSDQVKILLDVDNLEGENVLILEDLIDQGTTMYTLEQYLMGKKNAKSVEICALLQKQLESPSSKTMEIKKSICPKYMGFQIPDVWIAGYGIDAGEDFRHLPYIVSVNNEYYLE